MNDKIKALLERCDISQSLLVDEVLRCVDDEIKESWARMEEAKKHEHIVANLNDRIGVLVRGLLPHEQREFERAFKNAIKEINKL